MQIAKEILAEKNYEGSRLVEVTSPKLSELQSELDTLQQSINPVLEKLQAEYWGPLDPIYTEIQELNTKVKDLKDKVAEQTALFKAEIEAIEAAEQKAQLVKDKMQPLILETVKEQLGEFETAKHTVVKDGKIYVEVFDEIEEKVKAIRAAKK